MLSNCTIYTKIRSITLRNKKWIEITTKKNQKTNAGSRKIHKVNHKVGSFLPELIQKLGIINKETF